MELTSKWNGGQAILSEPEQSMADVAGAPGWWQRKFRLTLLFSVTALAVIFVAAMIANNVIGGIAERDLIAIAERSTFGDAIHIQSMMRGQHSMIGTAPGDPTGHGGAMSKMDQPMAMEQLPLTLELLAGPTGLPAHFPMLVKGLGIVKSNVIDLDGRTIWSTDSVSIGEIKGNEELTQAAANGQFGSQVLKNLEVVNRAGGNRKIVVVDAYSPLRETADGPVIGVLELFKDITDDVAVQVDEAKSAVLIITIATMGGLFLALVGFILIADLSINRGYRRGVELVEEANRTLEDRVKGRTAELATTNDELNNEIDERKRIEGDLLAARDVALEAVRAKSEFLASMSHEIRTPLNSIIGMADVLAETQLDEEQLDYVKVFQTAGDTLLHTINDILDLSKLDAGQLSLEGVDFDLRELVDNTAKVLAAKAREKGLVLNCSIAADVPTALVGDPARLGPVITNLLGNAIKFTDRGEVALHIENDSEQNLEGALRFTVSDTGIGIPADKLEVIFESFVQADSTTTREFGGTGLGLAISKRLVDLMGGRVWVESIVGEGTRFYFTARFEIQTEAMEDLPGHLGALDGYKVLVVDDHDARREILQDIVAAWGASTTGVSNGYQALAQLDSASGSGEPYDLLILDQQMPGMNGLEVAKNIHKDQQIACSIIILAPQAEPNEVARFQEMGVTCCLNQPIDRSELWEAIKTARNPANGRAEDTLPAPLDNPNTKALNILLVEDAVANRKLIHAYMKSTPHQIDIAENGEIAFRKFVIGNYDLVLMDMQMPVMDGYAATKAIRKWQNEIGISPTPIIALTAFAQNDEVQKSLSAGCTAHLAKPIKKAALMDAIYEYEYP